MDSGEIYIELHAEESTYILLYLQRNATQNVVNKTLENVAKFAYSVTTLTSKAVYRKTLMSDF